jgi:hypothetical protein
VTSLQAIASLAANISGDVYQPSDSEYATLVLSFNRRLTRHASIIVAVNNEQDVQKAVLFARKYFLMLSVYSQNGDFVR